MYDPLVKRRRVFGFLLLASVACGAYGAGREADTKGDAGAEGGVDATIEAAADDARGPSCDGAIFCDDFERSDVVGQGWLAVTTTQGGSVDVSIAHARSGTRSMRADVPGGEVPQNKTALLESRTFDAGSLPLVIEVDMLVETVPAYEGTPYNGFVPMHVATTPGAFVSVFSGISAAGAYNPYLVAGDEVIAIATGAWCHLALTFSSELVELSVTMPGSAPSTRARTLTVDPPSRVSLGVEVGVNGGPVRVYYDDLVVHH